MHMKKCQLVLFTLLGVILVSCQTDSEKADHFRLENKFAEAAELYKKAAAEGDAYAKWRLFEAYSNGDGVDYDERTSLELLKQAAAEGCEEAKCDLAFAYMFDWYDIGKDEDKGKSMLEELVKKPIKHTFNQDMQLFFLVVVVPMKRIKKRHNLCLRTSKTKTIQNIYTKWEMFI